MTFDELIDLVTSSKPEDWHTTLCDVFNAGPSYRYYFSFFLEYLGHPNVLFSEGHVCCLFSDRETRPSPTP